MVYLAEFAYNNLAASATGHSSFWTDYSFYLTFNWSTESTTLNPAAEFYSRHLDDIRNECDQKLWESCEGMSRYYDKRQQEGLIYKRENLVMLDGRNSQTRRLSRKLDLKYYGPFKIIEQISGNANRLELLLFMKIHPMFIILLLELFKTRHIPVRDQVASELVEIGGELECDVENILGSALLGDRGVQYLIKWKGYGTAESIWEPISSLQNALNILREFHK